MYHINDVTIHYPYLSCSHLMLISHKHISSYPLILSSYFNLSYPATTLTWTYHIPQTKSPPSIPPTIYKTLSYTLPTILLHIPPPLPYFTDHFLRDHILGPGSQLTDQISFESFKRFFSTHLLRLSKKQEIKLMKDRMKSTPTVGAMSRQTSWSGDGNVQHTGTEASFKESLVMDPHEEEKMTESLAALFRMMDKEGENAKPGFLSFEDVEEVLRSMDVQLTTMELEMMMADVELDDNGMVDYHQFLPKCTKLLVTLKAARLALASEHHKEVMADEKARKMAAATGREIDATIAFVVAR